MNDVKNEFILIQARGGLISGGSVYPRGAYIGGGEYPRGTYILEVECILFVGRRVYSWVASKWGVGELISGQFTVWLTLHLVNKKL